MLSSAEAIIKFGPMRKGTGDKSPRIWSWRDVNANCPLQILSYKYKYERSLAFKIRQTPTGQWGAHELSRLERGQFSPYLTPFGTDPPSVLAMRPLNSSQIYAYAFNCNLSHLFGLISRIVIIGAFPDSSYVPVI